MEVSPANRDVRPSAFAKLYYFMRPDRGRMVCSLVLACIGEAVGMVPYVVIALLAAGLIEGTLTFERAALLAAVAALAHVARFFCTWRSSMMSHRIAFKALATMRDQMAEKMERVPMGTIIDTPTGTFKNRFVDNVNQLEDAIAHFMPELPSNVFGPLLAMVIVFALDWRMGLAGLATIPLGVLFYAAMMRDYKPKMARYIGSEQRMNSSLVEYVNGIQVIKAFGRTASSYGGFSTAVAEYHDSTLAWFKQSWVWMAAVKSVVPCTLLVSLPLGVWLMSAGQLTLPIFLTCIVIPLGFIAPLLKFAQAGGQISRMDVCLNVIWDFLGTPELVRPAERVRLDGESFAFENVSFSYHEGAEVLHGVRRIPGRSRPSWGPAVRANRPWRSSWPGSGMQRTGASRSTGSMCGTSRTSSSWSISPTWRRTRSCSTARLPTTFAWGVLPLRRSTWRPPPARRVATSSSAACRRATTRAPARRARG